jgi:arylsulfatase
LGIVPAEAELSRHDPDVKPWAECSPDERKVFARMMEVYAGFLEHTDYHIGRLLDFLKRSGEFDNTLIIAVSDNGASSEGGPNGMININLWHNNLPGTMDDNLKVLDELGGPEHFNHYAWGWTFAGNTPFRRWKRETYRGGISDPLIVHWNKGNISKKAVRTQYAHAIDLLPTVLDCLGIAAPTTIRGVTQSSIEGVSFANTFNDAEISSTHCTQYFEMMGHRSIYHDGWRAVCPWPGPSFAEAGKFFGVPITAEELTKLDATGWELYHVAEDFSENHNVAGENRAKLIEMISLWYVEAGKYKVLPIDSRGATRLLDPRPQAAPQRNRYSFYPGTQVVPGNATVNVINRAHSITAEVDIPEGGTEGVLLSYGGNEGGYVFYVQNHKLHYTQNVVSARLLHVESVDRVPPGHHSLRFEFEPTGNPDIKAGKGVPGRGQLYFDGQLVGQAEFDATVPVTYGLGGGIACGADPGSPVTSAYKPPFHFTGTIYQVTIDVSGELIQDEEAEMSIIMAHQ